jgi:hypothetical protein
LFTATRTPLQDLYEKEDIVYFAKFLNRMDIAGLRNRSQRVVAEWLRLTDKTVAPAFYLTNKTARSLFYGLC